jgi:hypothetical protein
LLRQFTKETDRKDIANGTGKKVAGDADHSQQSEGSELSIPGLY